MSDLTEWIDEGSFADRTTLVTFTAAGTAFEMFLHPDTPADTFWLEAASAYANSIAIPADHAITFDAANGNCLLYSEDGTLADTVAVVLT